MKNTIKIIVLVVILAALIASIVYMKKNRKDELTLDDLSAYMGNQEIDTEIEDDTEDVYGIDDVDDETLSGDVVE